MSKQGEVGPYWLVFWEARLTHDECAGVEPAEEPPTPPDHPPLGMCGREGVASIALVCEKIKFHTHTRHTHTRAVPL